MIFITDATVEQSATGSQLAVLSNGRFRQFVRHIFYMAIGTGP